MAKDMERAETLRPAEPVCEVCGQPLLRRVSGNKYWCMACGHLQS